VIEAHGLSKRYGETVAVDDLSFVVRPGVVTGFLGPNGAGKSTTMRLILGLDAPTAGSVTVNGKPYRKLQAPLAEVGALLEARAIHTGRSAYLHLRALAESNGIGRQRVDEVIQLVGLEGVARRRVGTFSMGMGQRLGMAAALLGDPKTLVLDEPSNGLDPEGIRWIRQLLRSLAGQGKTIFVSSHLMSEMSLMADQLIVVGRGRLVADTSVDEFVRQASGDAVRVRTPESGLLQEALARAGVTIRLEEDGSLTVHGMPSEDVGELAAQSRIVLHELTPIQASLEEAFMRLTGDAVEYHASGLDETHEGAVA
jgi:ABC-2 type transport system ATP-binding protein